MQFNIVIIRYNLYQPSKEPAVKVDIKSFIWWYNHSNPNIIDISGTLFKLSLSILIN